METIGKVVPLSVEELTVNHVHTYQRTPATVRVKIERNSKGYNWEVNAEAENVDAVLALIREANSKLATEYGG